MLQRFSPIRDQLFDTQSSFVEDFVWEDFVWSALWWALGGLYVFRQLELLRPPSSI